MGAWGTGVFENDTALDTIAEMSELMEHYYKGLVDSDDEYNIMLAAFIYQAVKKDDAIEDFKVDPNQLLRHEIELVVKGLRLSKIEQYKYTIIGKLYKCLDEVEETWTDDYKESRRKTVKLMIGKMTEG